MEEKFLEVEIPEGYEIDKQNSTFEKIVFKKKTVRWRDTEVKRDDAIKNYISGSYIKGSSVKSNVDFAHIDNNRDVFATEKLAKSALAMAQISQIMANDKRFGDPVTDVEWNHMGEGKYVIFRHGKNVCTNSTPNHYHFLAFHTERQRELFMWENMDLIKDYLMID